MRQAVEAARVETGDVGPAAGDQVNGVLVAQPSDLLRAQSGIGKHPALRADMGEALGRAAVAIRPDDTPESLAARVRLAEHQLYPRVLANYISRSGDPDWLLGEVRRRALALAEVEERPSHGAPGWRTAGRSGKYFAYFSVQHHGSQAIALLVKTGGPEEQESLIASDPEVFFRPAFYGASGWVALVLDRPGLEWEQVEYWLERSWRAVAPRRLTHLLDAADEF